MVLAVREENAGGWANRVLGRGRYHFKEMVREDCPGKVLLRQIPERSEGASYMYLQKEHSGWRELSGNLPCWQNRKEASMAE